MLVAVDLLAQGGPAQQPGEAALPWSSLMNEQPREDLFISTYLPRYYRQAFQAI